jgi:hypothetical protein
MQSIFKKSRGGDFFTEFELIDNAAVPILVIGCHPSNTEDVALIRIELSCSDGSGLDGIR